jgi:hypothetical protein
MVEVAPDVVSIPIHAAVYRAPFGSADFSGHLSGQTGEGKSCLVALAQQHCGAELDARHLPASWSSTANALEGLAFAAKDALLVVDDFCPTGSSADVQRLHREADRLLRAQGNQTGRLRMRADTTLRPEKPPRGLILSTGEELPRGQSLRARLLLLELPAGSLDWQRLTVCQQDAAAGLYAQAFAGFIRWLAPQYEEKRIAFRRDVLELRNGASLADQHRRTPEIVANLAVAFRWFLRFAREAETLSDAEVAALWQRGWAALGRAAVAQASQRATEEPARRFLELLSAAIASGHAHVATPVGREPGTPEAWGWRPTSTGGYESEWRPDGARIGWLDGTDLYLEPQAAYAVAQRLAREAEGSIPVTLLVLKRRLEDQGFLVGKDRAREVLTVRRTLQGQRRAVLHLHAEALASLSPPIPDQPDQIEDNSPIGRASPPAATDDQADPTKTTDAATGGYGDVVGLVGSEAPEESATVNGYEGKARFTANPTPPSGKPDRCRMCGGRRFWQRHDTSPICGRCHPPTVEDVTWLDAPAEPPAIEGGR